MKYTVKRQGPANTGPYVILVPLTWSELMAIGHVLLEYDMAVPVIQEAFEYLDTYMREHERKLREAAERHRAQP